MKLETNYLLRKIRNEFPREVSLEDLKTYLDNLYCEEKENYVYKVGDLVKVQNNQGTIYIGKIGSFAYRKTINSRGPTEALEYSIALVKPVSKEPYLISSIYPTVKQASYASTNELNELKEHLLKDKFYRKWYKDLIQEIDSMVEIK